MKFRVFCLFKDLLSLKCYRYILFVKKKNASIDLCVIVTLLTLQRFWYHMLFTFSLISNCQIRFFRAFFTFQTHIIGVGNPITTTYWIPEPGQGANSLTFFLQEKIIISINRCNVSRYGEMIIIHCLKSLGMTNM